MEFLLVVGLVVFGMAFFIIRNVVFDMRVNKGLQAVTKGLFQDAVDLLLPLKERRKNLGVLWGLARAYHGLQNENESVKILKKIPLSQIQGNRYFNTKEYYLFYSDICKAMALYNDSIKYLVYLKNNGFDFWTVNLKIAEVFYIIRDLKKAVHHLFLCLEQNPKSWEAMLLLSKIYYEIRNFPRSAEFGQSALSVNHDCAEAGLYAGLSYYKMDRFGQSIEMLENVTAVGKQRVEYLNALGMSLYKMNDFAGAYDRLGPLLSLLPNYHILYKDVLYKLANSAEKIGRFKESFDYWKDLYTMDPKYSDAKLRYDLATLYNGHESFRIYLFSDPSHFRPFLLAVLGRLGANILKILDLSHNVVEAFCEIKTQEDAFVKVLYRFVRGLEVVDRKVVELFHFEMKHKSCSQGAIYTVGEVSSEVLHLTHIHSIAVIRENEFIGLLDQAYQDYRENMSKRV